MRCELVTPESPRWDSILARTAHDFYHLPGYARLSARVQDGEARGLLVSDGRGDLLLPLVLRDIPGGGRDATSPYGYPGPLTVGSDPGFLADALRMAGAFLGDEGVVSLFVRFHPLLNPPPGGVETIVRHGDTIAIDLHLTEEESLRQTRRNHRVQIDRARKAGHRVILDAGPEHDESFRRLYRETMARLGASPFYFFDDRYFIELRAVLGDHLHLAIVEIERETAAAGLFVETQGIVQYHLSGTDERFRREVPTKLMFDEVRRWARERGHRWLHLGGGLGFSEDSLFRFKAGFSSRRCPFHSLRMILRPLEYDRLVTAAGGEAGTAPSAGFFPAYRRPEALARLSLASGRSHHPSEVA
jgi:hypothetical protein